MGVQGMLNTFRNDDRSIEFRRLRQSKVEHLESSLDLEGGQLSLCLTLQGVCAGVRLELWVVTRPRLPSAACRHAGCPGQTEKRILVLPLGGPEACPPALILRGLLSCCDLSIYVT